MHELSFVQNIIEIIKTEMPKHNLTQIDTIYEAMQNRGQKTSNSVQVI